MKETFEKEPWFLEYELDDGARISRLCYHGADLLTPPPNQFKPPMKDFGEYENRPVYGYDDCFPSVESCKYPGMNWMVPDHGELCWLEWNAEIQSDKIIFSVESEVLPLLFTRILHFRKSQLIWRFEVQNKGRKTLPFQHVIHPLIKLTEIKDLQFPDFALINNEIGELLDFKTPKDFRDFLLSTGEGETYMLYLQSPKGNYVQWTYKNGLQVKMEFPANKFSTIGVWWNHLGYPDEEGCRRCECAFEPISGSSSKLEDVYNEGHSHFIEPGEVKSWNLTWKIELE